MLGAAEVATAVAAAVVVVGIEVEGEAVEEPVRSLREEMEVSVFWNQVFLVA